MKEVNLEGESHSKLVEISLTRQAVKEELPPLNPPVVHGYYNQGSLK
jgi:hypothetical protein